MDALGVEPQRPSDQRASHGHPLGGAVDRQPPVGPDGHGGVGLHRALVDHRRGIGLVEPYCGQGQSGLDVTDGGVRGHRVLELAPAGAEVGRVRRLAEVVAAIHPLMPRTKSRPSTSV